jgi:hypothetical protein
MSISPEAVRVKGESRHAPAVMTWRKQPWLSSGKNAGQDVVVLGSGELVKSLMQGRGK